MFILDQHACDEKFNFETLSQTTVLSAQDLVIPIKLRLGVNDELAINLHREIFKINGFKIEQQDDVWLLKSLPISKGITFNETDFHELVEKIQKDLDLS